MARGESLSNRGQRELPDGPVKLSESCLPRLCGIDNSTLISFRNQPYQPVTLSAGEGPRYPNTATGSMQWEHGGPQPAVFITSDGTSQPSEDLVYDYPRQLISSPDPQVTSVGLFRGPIVSLEVVTGTPIYSSNASISGRFGIDTNGSTSKGVDLGYSVDPFRSSRGALVLSWEIDAEKRRLGSSFAMVVDPGDDGNCTMVGKNQDGTWFVENIKTLANGNVTSTKATVDADQIPSPLRGALSAMQANPELIRNGVLTGTAAAAAILGGFGELVGIGGLNP